MKYILLFTILLGCTVPVYKSADYENARRATIDAWEEVIGPVSDQCYKQSKDAIITETGRFPESCIPPLETGTTYIGCYMPTEIFGLDGDIIFIYDGRTEQQKLDTAVHEFVHLLHFCEFGGSEQNVDDYINTLYKCMENVAVTGEPGNGCRMPGDYFHLDEHMWDRIQIPENGYGTNTVEAIGCANLIL